jgi:hypothetical protein
MQYISTKNILENYSFDNYNQFRISIYVSYDSTQFDLPN